MLGVRADGRWAAPESALICPRQNGKGGVLEALELYLLFLCDEVELVVHTSHRFDTAQDHFRRIRGLIENTPSLMKRVKAIRVANGSEGIELKDGKRLLFKARSKGGIRGLSPDGVVLDEAFYLWDEAVSAILPSMAARPNPLRIYASSSPIAGPESDFLRRMCLRGRKGSPTLGYVEYSAPPDADLDDQDVWHDANPSLGTLLTVEALLVDRGAMTDEGFGIEHLGVWSEVQGEPPAIDPAKWSAAKVADPYKPDPGWLQSPVCFGLELTAQRDWSTFVPVGRTRSGKFGIDGAIHHPGTDWVLDRAVTMNEKHAPRFFVIDPKSQAGSFIQPFRDAGLPVLECGYQDLVRATAGIYDAIVNDGVEHRDDQLINSAVSGAIKRTYGDAWLWDRRAGVTLTPLVAATLGWAGVNEPESSKPKPQVIAFYS